MEINFIEAKIRKTRFPTKSVKLNETNFTYVNYDAEERQTYEKNLKTAKSPILKFRVVGTMKL